jgi:hypothetical protein
MATPENRIWPGWSRTERGRDVAWIQENIALFHQAAVAAFEEIGRGAIVVDVTTPPVPGASQPCGYFGQQEMDAAFDEDTKRMVGQYDPAQEVVLVLLKPAGRTSTYRVRARPPGGPEGDSGPARM